MEYYYLDESETSDSSNLETFSFTDSEDGVEVHELLTLAPELHPGLGPRPGEHAPHDPLDNEIPDNLSQPLYDGANLTTLESSILLLQFSIRHKLSKAALSGFLQLVKTHLPVSSQSVRSTYMLKNLFTSKFFCEVHPYLCSCCERLLPSSASCDRDDCVGDLTTEFIYVPLD